MNYFDQFFESWLVVFQNICGHGQIKVFIIHFESYEHGNSEIFHYQSQSVISL